MRRFAFAGQDILVPADPARGPAVPEPAWLDLSGGAALLREFDDLRGSRSSACSVSDESAAPFVESGEFRRMTLREALGLYGAEDLHAAVRGYALLRALEASRFCGFCGGVMRDNGPDGQDGTGRVCSACGRLHFPRISPAVIVLIRKGPRALVAHNAHFPAGRFGLIAGFVEAGESLEEAAKREAREEAGIEIRDLRYAKSQSWPFPDSLMMAFTAEWESGEACPDGEEIVELRWCLSSELPDIPPKGSVARFLLDEFAKAP
jgi:NTP pyrophosphohydrolases containing a Zn-finger, probably nucleic-acid-binding